MQLIDRPWQDQVHPGGETDYLTGGLASESPISPFPGQTEGLRFRRYVRAWSLGAGHAFSWPGSPRPVPNRPKAPATDEVVAQVASGLINEWPRLLQAASICFALAAAIFAAAHVVSAAGGIAVCFAFLATVFFGNFAAYRRGSTAWLVGPTLAVLATWGCLIIAVAIGLNVLFAA